LDEDVALFFGNGGDDSLDLAASPLRYGSYQVNTSRRQDEAYLPAIPSFAAANNQLLFNQSVAHPSGSRGRNAHGLGQLCDILRPARSKYDERAVLSQRDVFANVGQ
jgi:hypothetical protein